MSRRTHRSGAGLAVAWMLWGAIAVSACVPDVAGLMPSYRATGPTPGEFAVCHGYSCSYRTAIRLTDQEWDAVRATFAPRAAEPAAERRQVAEAVALMERLVGARTGTSTHQRRAFFNSDPTQLDCIDEAANTSVFMTVFARDGLLAHHRVGEPAHQGTLLVFDLHNTAVLVETKTGAAFAVDPNLVEATVPPPIVPLAIWRASWPPALPKQAAQSRLGT